MSKPSGRILVTGANGFVGRSVLSRLQRDGFVAFGAVRRTAASGFVMAPTLGPDSDWQAALVGCTAIVHTAARVHVMQEQAADPLAAFRHANVAGTLSLARQAANAGVRRFVFVSSIKVNGEITLPGQAFSAEDRPASVDPYGTSKAEAEAGLLAVAAQSGMEVVIVRPPLVYGPGVKANFLRMMNWLAKGLPLPFGSIINNRRSLVSLDNLVDLLVTCVDHPAAANQVFLAGDGEDLSTVELLRRLAAAMGVPARLIPVPIQLLELVAAAVGKEAVFQRLCGNLQVDISKTRALLNWSPPIGVDEGLLRTAREKLQGSTLGS